jgi:hypothetical protein
VVANQTAANKPILISMAHTEPKFWLREKGARLGIPCHIDHCHVPKTEPAMKAASVISIRILPPPTVNRVPDAQPPPSCMPTPNMKAPQMTAMFKGAILPLRLIPQISPCAINGVNRSTVIPSMII